MAKRTASSKLSRKVASRKSRKKRNLKKRSNPSAVAKEADGIISHTWAELATMALPGLGGYAGGRAAGWLTYRVLKKRSPRLAKHAGPLGSVAFAIGASYATRRFESLQKYDLPIIVGAWIAALQSGLQTYAPAMSWVLGDWNMTEFLAPAKAAARANAAQVEQLEGYDQAYAEAFESAPAAEPLPATSGEDTFDDIPGLNDEGVRTGIFAGGLSN